jgi:hypothetical protein
MMNRYESASIGSLLTTLQPPRGFEFLRDDDRPSGIVGQRVEKYLVEWEIVSIGGGDSYEPFQARKRVPFLPIPNYFIEEVSLVELPSGSVLRKVRNLEG